MMTDIIKCRSGRYSTFCQCERRADRLGARYGHWRGSRLLELQTFRTTTQSASIFLAIHHIDTLDDPNQPYRRMLKRRSDPDPTPIARMIHEERIVRIPAVLATLPPRDFAILQKRFGLDGSGHESTLEEIGAVHHLTKERVRQILFRVLGDLRSRFDEPTESEETALPPETAGRRNAPEADPPPTSALAAAGVVPSSLRATQLAPSSRACALRSQDAAPARLFNPTANGVLPDSRPPDDRTVHPEAVPDAVVAAVRVPDVNDDTLPRPLQDVKLIERALSEANDDGGILVSDLIATLRLSGTRVRTAIHVLARSGEVERGSDLRWKRAGTTPPRKTPLKKPAGPAAIQSAISVQPALSGANH